MQDDMNSYLQHNHHHMNPHHLYSTHSPTGDHLSHQQNSSLIHQLPPAALTHNAQHQHQQQQSHHTILTTSDNQENNHQNNSSDSKKKRKSINDFLYLKQIIYLSYFAYLFPSHIHVYD